MPSDPQPLDPGQATAPEPVPAAAGFRVLRDPYVFSSNDRWVLIAFGVVWLVVISVWLAPSVRAYLPGCPTKNYLDLNCPGCGLSRGTIALARLDLAAALNANPLVFFVGGYCGYLVGFIGVGLVTGRRLFSNIPLWFNYGVQYAFALTWMALFVVRLASWISPGLNPDGWLLPV